MTDNDSLYQPLVEQASAFCDLVESQDLDARCCELEPETLGRLARRLQDNFDLATSRLDIITGKLERDYGAAAGLTLWQIGYIGEIVFPIDGSPGLLERGKLKDWLAKYGLKRQRFQDARHVRKRFKREEARKLGYRTMRDVIAQEKHDGEEPDEEKQPKKPKGGPKRPWTLRGDLVKTLERVVSKLSTIVKRLPDATDIDDDPHKNYPAIIEARALLKEAARLYPDVEDALDNAEELNSDENDQRAELIRDELRLHPIRGGEDHGEPEVCAVLPVER